MIPQTNSVKVESFGGTATRQMSISNESRVHIMTVLANLYSNSILAVIREYSTNAMDSHISAGTPEKPIKVSLPNSINPFFTVEDFGIGMTEDEVYDVYGSYGTSTKRESNDFNGQLGFGCKSAFSYTDQFTVTSVKDGILRTFIFSLSEDGAGEITKMEEYATDRPNGVKVSIPVKTKDISSFTSTARDFYTYWDVIPEGIQISNPKYELEVDVENYKAKVESFHFYRNGNNVRFLMGGVVYPAPPAIMEKFHKDTECKFSNLTVLIKVPIGEVFFTPSRESLKNTPNLESIILKCFNAITERIKHTTSQVLERSETFMEAKTSLAQLSSQYASLYNNIIEGLTYKGYRVDKTVFLENAEAYYVYSRCKNTQFSVSLAKVEISPGVHFLIVPHAKVDEEGILSNIKVSEYRLMRKYLMENTKAKGSFVIVQDKSEIPSTNKLFGIPVLTIGELKDIYKVERNKVTVSSPKGTGLYIYTNPSNGVSRNNEKLFAKDMPAPGSEIILVVLEGNYPSNPKLFNLGSYQSHAYNIATSNGSVIYSTRRGNLEKIKKLYKVKLYEDYLVEVIIDDLKNNPLSSQASHSNIFIEDRGLIETNHKLIKKGIQYTLDEELNKVLADSENAYSLLRKIINNSAGFKNHLTILQKLKGFDYVDDLIRSFYTDGVIKVEGIREVYCKYPLLTFLSSSDANIEDVRNYINAMYLKGEK